MSHKAQKQKILLTNENVLINRKYKTQSYNNLYNEILKKL